MGRVTADLGRRQLMVCITGLWSIHPQMLGYRTGTFNWFDIFIKQPEFNDGNVYEET